MSLTPFDETGPDADPIIPKPGISDPSDPGPLTLPPRPEIDAAGRVRC